MHRVMKRTWVVHVFLLILLSGMAFFLWEYTTEAQRWVAATGSPHLYNNSNIGCGTIVDRSGTVLLDISTKYMTSSDTYFQLASINPDVKVIVAQTSDRDDAIVNLKKAGFTNFIQKPYPIDMISQKIAEF